MPLLHLRKLALLLIGCSLVLLTAASARADLVWTPETGWRLEGGLVTGLTGEDGRRALDLMNRARDAEENKSYFFAARRYEKVGKRYPLSVYAPEALYRAGQMRLARKQYYRAFDDLSAIITTYPNTERFNDIIGEIYRIASALLDGARNRMWFGMVPGPRYPERAISYYEFILSNAPYSDYAPLALMNIARGYTTKVHDTEAAINAYDRMINDYPDSLLTPDATLKLAQAFESYIQGPAYDQRDTRDAESYYLDFMINYPSDPNVGVAETGLDRTRTMLAESKMVMGDFYFYKRDNITAARVLYNDAITAYPDSDIAAKARDRLTEVDAREKVLAEKNSTAADNSRKWYWPF